jgi:sugar phosphate isomerase/epimerase
MKLACADFAFPLLPHDRVLDLIQALGLAGVDIGLFEGRSHLWPSRVFRNLSKSARALRRKVADRGLQIADVFLHPANDLHTLAPNHPDKRRRARVRALFEKTVEWTKLVGADHVTALPGVFFDSEPKLDSLQRCAEEMAWRCERASQAGLTFSVEPHRGSVAPTPQQALRLVAMTPGLSLTLDYTHFTAAGFRDADIEPLLAHASHIHARGARRGRVQASVAHNTIDYGAMLRKLKQLGYNRWIELEYVWMEAWRCNEVDNLSETIRLRDLLRKHL